MGGAVAGLRGLATLVLLCAAALRGAAAAACDPSCSKCDAKGACTACPATLGLNATKRCVPCADPKCFRCSSNFQKCAECRSSHKLKDGKCAQCAAGYGRVGKDCVACKAKNCVRCDSNPSKCQACASKSGFELYLNSDRSLCIRCRAHPQCIKCDGLRGACRACAAGYGLVGGTCKKCAVADCERCDAKPDRCKVCAEQYVDDGIFRPQYPNANGTACVTCQAHPQCVTCNGAGGACTACDAFWGAVGGTCKRCLVEGCFNCAGDEGHCKPDGCGDPYDLTSVSSWEYDPYERQCIDTSQI